MKGDPEFTFAEYNALKAENARLKEKIAKVTTASDLVVKSFQAFDGVLIDADLDDVQAVAVANLRDLLAGAKP